MRDLSAYHGAEFDVVIACDNAVPHLMSDVEIRGAFGEMLACARPGGGCIISVRDYAAMEREPVKIHPYGVRHEGGVRYVVLQVWEFHGDLYDLHMYLVEDKGGEPCETRVMRSTYYAIGTDRLIDLMQEAGWTDVRRIDGRFFQPLIIGTRPA